MVATIRAEDAFDVCADLHRITAPTLIVGGARDGFYGEELFRRTADAIPGARLVLHPRAGHAGMLSSRAAHRGVARFLLEAG
jgi:pimeloyl-ACP methyl ester carboxylesterase